MLTFATIAAGSPSQMAGMTGHLLSQTLPREIADLARSYARTPEAAADGTPAEMRRDIHPLAAEGLGVEPGKALTSDQLNALLGGNRADGEKIAGKYYSKARSYVDPLTGETNEKTPIGSVDFCLTPDKSVSLAWAFGVPSEQAAIYQAHRDAGAETIRYLESRIALAKIGHAGAGGAEPGHVGYVAFDHYTSRPTLRAGGDPDLHTHFTMMNAVFCESGRVGSLDLDKLKGLIKEGGALYQAHLATRLREIGAHVVLDEKTGMARLPAIPEHVRDHFSKKTRNGEAAAREYTKAQGLDWDALPEGRRVKLMKAGTQGMPSGLDAPTRRRLTKDDMADFASWRQQAEALGWRHATIEAQGPPMPTLERGDRLKQAYDAALPWLEKDLGQRPVISGPDVRTAALRGLIAAGIEDTRDVGLVTRILRREGVRQDGEMTALVWAEDARERVRVTTARHLAQSPAILPAGQQSELAELFRQGQVDSLRQALEMKRRDGTAEMVPGGYDQVVARAAALVRERLESNRQLDYSLTVSAPTDLDAHRLGAAIREAKREIDRLGADRVLLKAADDSGHRYDMPVATGDRVRLFKSVRAAGQGGSIGRDGSVLYVVDADAEGMTVINEHRRMGVVAWKSLADAEGRVRLAYGEARTRPAQGSTEHIHVLPVGSLVANALGGMRHPQRSFLLLSEGAEKADVKRHRAEGDLRPITREEAWDRVAANLSRQPEKSLTLDLLAKTGAVRRGTIRGFQKAMRPIEVRERASPETARAHSLYLAFQRQQQARALRPALAALRTTAKRQQTVMQDVLDMTRRVTQAVRQRVEAIVHRQGHERQVRVGL